MLAQVDTVHSEMTEESLAAQENLLGLPALDDDAGSSDFP